MNNQQIGLWSEKGSQEKYKPSFNHFPPLAFVNIVDFIVRYLSIQAKTRKDNQPYRLDRMRSKGTLNIPFMLGTLAMVHPRGTKGYRTIRRYPNVTLNDKISHRNRLK